MGRYEVVEELVHSEERLRSLRKALEPYVTALLSIVPFVN